MSRCRQGGRDVWDVFMTQRGVEQRRAPGGVLFVGSYVDKSIGTRGISLDIASHLGAEGWFVETTSNKAGRLQRVADMLCTVLRWRSKYSIGVIDVYSGPAFLWAQLIGYLFRRLHKPYILTLHGGNLPRFALEHPVRVRRTLRGADAVTTPSSYLREAMGKYRADLAIVPNPIDVSRYPFRVRDSPTPTLVWLRAFHDVYQPWVAVAATNHIRKSFPRVHLELLGPDKRDGSLERVRTAIRSHDLRRNVTVSGPVAKRDVPSVLKRADIFLNTAKVDNTPVSVLEAMACGLCVVSTNVGGIPFLLEHERDALLVPPDDPLAIAEAVKRILMDRALARRISTNARAKAEQFDIQRVLRIWRELVLRIRPECVPAQVGC